MSPPSSRPFTLKFTSLVLVDSIYYSIDSSTLTYSPLTGTLTNPSLTADSYLINDPTRYEIAFTTVNPLIAGSFISVTFPSTITLTGSTTCAANHSSISTCTISSSSYANLTLSGSLPGGTSIKLIFNAVTNPNQAITTSSIQVRTFYDFGVDSAVDTITSGLTITTLAR